MSFIKQAQRRVTDIRSFLKEQSSGGNSIRYRAEPGKKHTFYIPYTTTEQIDENGDKVTVKEPVCITGNVHEWNTPDGKYHSCVCLDGVINKDPEGNILNDGTCPFCNRINDAWDIYNIRYAKEEENCKLTGAQRDEHLKASRRNFGDERKIKPATMYWYLLVAQYRTDDSGKIVEENGQPQYDLKVMKLSSKRMEKFQAAFENAGLDEMIGNEMVINYPKVDDLRLAVGQSTTSPAFMKIVDKHPGLADKINADAAKFDFEGLDKQGFSEWAGMTTAKAKEMTDSMFEQYDKYKAELKVNPNAKYLEYVTSTPETNPSLSGAPAVPTIAAAPAAPAAPSIPAPGANVADLFNGAGGITL